MRTCSVCRTEKPLSEFHRNVTKPDKLEYACRLCIRKRRAGHHTVGKSRTYDPIKDRARGKLRDAVRYSRIVKPTHCEVCDEPVSPKLLDGHHHLGYSFPLKALWLCRQCHTATEHVFL